MTIIITDRKKVFAIQEEFNLVFPYLKLEFLSKSSRSTSSSDKDIKHNGKTLAECRTIQNNRSITIDENMTVADLEQNFRDVYGLGVHVMRQSGKVWLEATITGGWSLAEQNKQGEDLCKQRRK